MTNRYRNSRERYDEARGFYYLRARDFYQSSTLQNCATLIENSSHGSDLFPLPCSLFLVPCSLFLVPCSLFLVPTSYFLLPTSYFLLPTSYFLLPTSYFLLPTSYFLLPHPSLHILAGFDFHKVQWSVTGPLQALTFQIRCIRCID